MATQTTNYGLTKPSYNETADIGVINSNMDIIDAKMKAIENKAGSGGGGGNTDTYGHVKVGSVTIDASGDDTIELVAGSNVTLTPDTTSKSVTISATGGGGGGTPVTVDSELSTTSENPVQNKVITQELNGKGTYSKPTGGIPKTDLASEVQTSLGKADTALQEHQDISGKANKADLTALSNTISDAWNASTTYGVGQYCIYNNSLWKCLVQNNGQTPTEGTYWANVSVANEIASVNNSLVTSIFINRDNVRINFGNKSSISVRVINGQCYFYTDVRQEDIPEIGTYSGAILANIPDGYRPKEEIYIPIVMIDTENTLKGCKLRITTSGEVWLTTRYAATSPTNNASRFYARYEYQVF